MHFFKQVNDAINLERKHPYKENPKSDEDLKRNKQIEDNADKITHVVMGHIEASLEAFNNHLKLPA